MVMETPKEQAIKAAYGELYDKYEDRINKNNGYIHYKGGKVLKELRSIVGEVELHPFYVSLFRPKSISGIENNRGWTRIESEEDLPEVLMDYWVIIDGIVRKGFRYYGNGRWTNADNPYPKTTSSYKITHYQPIPTPKPPIF